MKLWEMIKNIMDKDVNVDYEGETPAGGMQTRRLDYEVDQRTGSTEIPDEEFTTPISDEEIDSVIQDYQEMLIQKSLVGSDDNMSSPPNENVLRIPDEQFIMNNLKHLDDAFFVEIAEREQGKRIADKQMMMRNSFIERLTDMGVFIKDSKGKLFNNSDSTYKKEN
tara:strand:+ start:1901 stop:2398 length:498 start_codon:yes stop_codon:yes gene_type:complete